MRKIRGKLVTALLTVAIFNAYATTSYEAVTNSGKYPDYPQANYGTGAQAELIKKGEYLTKMGDCIACHTAEGGKPFAGGRPIKTPFGTIFTPNITPDKQTGIGNMTEQQFITAMHEGKRPDGKYDYPAFPYLYFTRVTTEDVQAIRAYLNAIPAINQANQKNTMMFPFNIRFFQLGWRILYFNKDQGVFKPDPKQSAAWNRGKYLVDGLGHCSMCHTQSHVLVFQSLNMAAPIKKYYLAGGMVDGFYAPNITSTLLKGKPVGDLENVFRHQRLIGGGTVQGPMAEANHDSLKYLTDDDIAAIDTYLISVKSEAPPRPNVGKGLEAGQKIFNQYCEGCHLTGAGGAPKYQDPSAWDPLIKKGMNELYKNAINGIGGMPPKGTCSSCTDQQVQDAVQYMIAGIKPGVGVALGHANVVEFPKMLSLEDGKQLYQRYCAVCHEGNYQGAPKTGDKTVWQPLIQQGMETLILRTIHGYKNMPARGSCATCNDAQIIAAVKYMVQESKTSGDYILW